jgi:hypothetical protein
MRKIISTISALCITTAALAQTSVTDDLLQKIRNEGRPFSVAQVCSCSNPSGNIGDKDCRDHRYWICRNNTGSNCAWEQGAEVC